MLSCDSNHTERTLTMLTNDWRSTDQEGRGVRQTRFQRNFEWFTSGGECSTDLGSCIDSWKNDLVVSGELIEPFAWYPGSWQMIILMRAILALLDQLLCLPTQAAPGD